MRTRSVWWGGLVVAAMVVVAGAAAGAPPASAQAGTRLAKLDAQVREVSDQLAAAHARNMALQAEVTDLEKRNAARKQQLQQRDAQIAQLQQQLAAAGGSTPASSVAPAGSH